MFYYKLIMLKVGNSEYLPLCLLSVWKDLTIILTTPIL